MLLHVCLYIWIVFELNLKFTFRSIRSSTRRADDVFNVIRKNIFKNDQSTNNGKRGTLVHIHILYKWNIIITITCKIKGFSKREFDDFSLKKSTLILKEIQTFFFNNNISEYSEYNIIQLHDFSGRNEFKVPDFWAIFP